MIITLNFLDGLNRPFFRVTIKTMINLQKEKILFLAREYHKGQTRAGNVPYWYHVLSVAQILQNAFSQTKELKNKEIKTVLIAAVGHDLYEDTKIDRSEIIKFYDKKVDQLIWELTNEEGDSGHTDYEKKIQNASDEAKLIKLADSIENAISVAYTIFDLGLKWVDEFYLPILENMRPNIKASQFKKYPKTAKLLNDQLDFVCQRLYENADKYRFENKK